ncbi:hypothetical protein [Puniceibacterium sediminis]|uniref:hypothetical protein n=1 Tax=Puniceibacterium sediminis TaxID=1608407 RepID=UPI0015963C90|nr:hypothetical protein [Puniceibacterium sediminis]
MPKKTRLKSSVASLTIERFDKREIQMAEKKAVKRQMIAKSIRLKSVMRVVPRL